MGCSNVKQNVTIDISYCGGCGWSLPAKKICQQILKQIPQATIDCRPQEGYTGVLIATLIIDSRQKKEVYKGDKQNTSKNPQKIAQEILQAYKNC